MTSKFEISTIYFFWFLQLLFKEQQFFVEVFFSQNWNSDCQNTFSALLWFPTFVGKWRNDENQNWKSLFLWETLLTVLVRPVETIKLNVNYKIKILGGLFPTAFSFKIVCFSIAWLFARRAIERYNNSTDKIHS